MVIFPIGIFINVPICPILYRRPLIIGAAEGISFETSTSIVPESTRIMCPKYVFSFYD